MSIVRLAWAYLGARPLLTALHLAMVALGMGTMVVAVLFTAQTEERLQRDAAPVDLVVGAKGSPLQLILSALLHVDVPTGNIPYAEAKRLAAHPMVAGATPVSVGDSFRGFRIVGTDESYLPLYGAALASGRPFAREMEAVVGSQVAARTGVGPGARITGSHGMTASGASHEGHPYEVVGVLAPTGTVVDRLVVTPLESVWEVHGAHAQGPDAAQDITALLLRYRTPLAAASLPRFVNATTVMQAASPAQEMARLMNLIGVGVETLRLFALVLMVTAALSVLVSLTSALQERRYDLALLRTLGARPAALFALLAAEGVTLVVGGVILGLALGHVVTEGLGRWLARSNPWTVTGLAWSPQEAWIALAVVAAGAAACLLPAIQAYTRDPAVLLKR